MSARSRSLKLNMITGLLQELVAVVCGLILPRVVLSYFGSTYNGIVNSITQFMAFSVIFRSGLGAVTNAALYKPLAEKNDAAISGIMAATRDFMNKVGILLALCIVGFAAVYPLIVADEFHYLFSFSLVLIIGASSFVENMFSIKYKILLQADQKYYVQTVFAIIAHVLSMAFSIVLIVAGAGIHVVKLGAVVGMASTPLMLKAYVDRHYCVDWKAKPDNVAIKSRWDAFAQQLAHIMNQNVATIVLTFFLPLGEVSVYSIYHMVTRNVTNLFSSTLNGAKATFGNMIAREEHKNLQEQFANIEFLTYICATIIFVTTAILIKPFVLLYTRNITDVNYDRYWLGILISFVSMMTVVRIPYQLLVEAAGIFKETRNGAFVEMGLNVGLSALFVRLFGVVGVVIGGFVAALVRTSQFAVVSHRKVLQCSMRSAIKNYCLYFAMSIGLVALANALDCFNCASFGQWIVMAAVVCVAVSAAVTVLSCIFNLKQSKLVILYLLKKRGRRHVA